MSDLPLSFDNGRDAAAALLGPDRLRGHMGAATSVAVGQRAAARGGMALSEGAHAEGRRLGNYTRTQPLLRGARSEADLAEQETGRPLRLIGHLAHSHRSLRPFGRGSNVGSRLTSRAARSHFVPDDFNCAPRNRARHYRTDPEGWVETGHVRYLAPPSALPVRRRLPIGAMRGFRRSLNTGSDLGGRFRRTLAADCVPLPHGRVGPPIHPFLAAA